MKSALFYFLTVFTLYSAWFVVTVHNLFRSAIGLIAVLLGISGLYMLMDAQFLAAVQVTVYVGGIVVLIVFVVLLVSDVSQKALLAASRWRQAAAGLMTVLLFALLCAVLLRSDFSVAPGMASRSATVAETGRALLSPEKGGFVLPFEVISLVLTAAIVGAISVAHVKDRKAGEKGGKP
jgi:NADH-quinone oxidoreductase subunit J